MKMIRATLVMTEKMQMISITPCHVPISSAPFGKGRRQVVVIFQASTRISTWLLTSASTGASGKAAEKRVA